ncbi:hypothetical protein F5880DRAFT_1558463 [Lentinula raphanica]|nr:hypothetical protein F5880DRAFT_1558463 [Lentinula raphanica]
MFVTGGYSIFPLMRLRTTPRDVERINEHVQDWIKNGLYAGSVIGTVIGTACDGPMLVHIPVDLGINNLRSIDDLNVRPYMWMPNSPEFKSYERNREHVNHFPTDAATALDHPFTFYFEENSSRAANNNLIRKAGVPYDYNPVPSVRGNVLIVKHNRDGSMENMVEEDWMLVKVILEWIVANRWNYTATCLHGIPKPLTVIRSIPAVHEAPPGALFKSPIPSHIRLLERILYIRDLRLTLFANTGVVTLFALGATCSTLRTWVQAFYRTRAKHLLDKVFPGLPIEDFFELLNLNEARIGGSFAYAIVDPTSIFTPRDLNILSPTAKGDSLRDMLVAEWKCTREPDEPNRPTPNNDDDPEWTMYLRSASGYTITITESDDRSLLPLMLTGYSTAECVLVGGHTFTLLYPSLVENGEVLRLPSLGRPIPDSVFDTISNRFKLLDSTEYLGRRCGECCPNIWRRTMGMRGSATLYWGGLSEGRDSRLRPGSYEWKIAHACRNPLCEWRNVSPMEMCQWLWWEVNRM